MTSGQAELRQAAEHIAGRAAECAGQNERDRRLAPDLLVRLRESGLMRCGAPEAIGAAEAPPAVALGCAETIAQADAATGWCVSIAMTSSLLAGYLPPDSAAEMLGDPRAIAAGVWAPRATGRRVDGGLVVSGRWAFCSGIRHADHFFGGCVVDDDGSPAIRVVGIPTGDLRILDTWRTSGLCGTGSDDAVADEVFVPDRRIFSIADGPVVDAPLYRFPIFGYFALCVAAVALGNARGAIGDLLGLAGHKIALGARRTLAEKATTQSAVAQAEAALRAARAFFYSAIDDAWAAAQAGGEVSVELRTGLRLAAVHAARTAADVVRQMYDLGGGTAIYDESPLQRRFRDASTITAHIQVSPGMWELTGRLLLGLPTDVAQL
jgi:alkylation response protein AidB-like acyl-CoA dehydrogenase